MAQSRLKSFCIKKKRRKHGSLLRKPGKRLHAGDQVIFAPDFSAEILEKREGGEILIRFSVADEKLPCACWSNTVKRRCRLISSASRANNPRMIARVIKPIYAAREGAVAAPTAGLHFTPELFANLAAKGIECATVTLHVGAGTFLPVKAEFVRDHVMHAEWGEIAPGIAAYINKAKREGRRVVAVGTTSLRLLEAAADEKGTVHPFQGDTNIFIYPGYRFRAVDALLTNFHLPQSTLFMLVCAFAGMGRMQGAYAHAIAQRYRFYSYGDATLLEKGIDAFTLRFHLRHRWLRAAQWARDATARIGTFETPAFMATATAATVKAMLPESVQAAGAELALCNTYHLMLRPGAERVAVLGGLHKFMNWPGPILTDSGGYQVMSLAKLRDLDEQGVTFRSHLDGTKYQLTPERAMQIQHLLDSNITMCFDECTPHPATHEQAAQSRCAFRCAGLRAASKPSSHAPVTRCSASIRAAFIPICVKNPPMRSSKSVSTVMPSAASRSARGRRLCSACWM